MIRMYIGLLGQGKTLMMIRDAWPYIIASAKPNSPYKIVSNQPIRVNDPLGHTIVAIPPTSGQALIDSFYNDFNTLFLLDEAQLIFPAYKMSSITEDLQARFAYTRKYGCTILYTCQGYNHAHKRLRDLTNEICRVKKLPHWWIWRHVATYFDPERFDASKVMTPEQEAKFIIYQKYAFFWELGKIYRAYDTFYVSTTTIAGDGITIDFKQPATLGVIQSLYDRI